MYDIVHEILKKI